MVQHLDRGAEAPRADELMALQPALASARTKSPAALGAGGMGDVYRATRHEAERDVAIKLLPEAFARRSGAAGAVRA